MRDSLKIIPLGGLGEIGKNMTAVEYRGKSVYLPLAGEDIFLTVDDLREYCSVVLGFWQELGAAIRATHEQDENGFI